MTFSSPVLVVGQAGSGGGTRVSSGRGIGINVSNRGVGAIGVSADTKAGGAVALQGTNETDAKSQMPFKAKPTASRRKPLECGASPEALWHRDAG